MNQIVQIAHNAVVGKLINASREVKLIVREELSYMVDGVAHMPAFKSSGWDGQSSFFDFTKETFPAGFVNRVYSRLTKAGYRVQIVRKPFPAPLGETRPVVDDFGDDPRYGYQHHVYENLLRHGQMIAKVATGGGKSRIARLAYRRIKRNTLFLTTRGILMYQMRDAVVENLKEPVGIMGDDEWSPLTDGFNVGMVQTLAPLIEAKSERTEVERLVRVQIEQEDRKCAEFQALLKKKKIDIRKHADALSLYRAKLERERKTDIEMVAQAQKRVADHNAKREKALAFLKTVEFVILEEAHEVSGEGFFNLMQACPNAHYRLALTGTPFMKDSAEANMRLEAVSGGIAIEITEKQLIDLGILARPFFFYVPLSLVPNGLYRSTPWQKAYTTGIVENEERNRAIVFYAGEARNFGLTSLVLVQHKAHGKLLMQMMTDAGVRCNFIYGDHDQKERQAALNALRDGKIDCLIGSTILDVGVDAPAIGVIILAGGGKAEVQLRQRIGRGLRAKKKGPNVAFVIDFLEILNNHLREHAQSRRIIIEQTPGFNENILAKPLRFEEYGFSRLAVAA